MAVLSDAGDAGGHHRNWECSCLARLDRCHGELSFLFLSVVAGSCRLGEIKTKGSLGSARLRMLIRRNNLIEDCHGSKLTLYGLQLYMAISCNGSAELADCRCAGSKGRFRFVQACLAGGTLPKTLFRDLPFWIADWTEPTLIGSCLFDLRLLVLWVVPQSPFRKLA